MILTGFLVCLSSAILTVSPNSNGFGVSPNAATNHVAAQE
jgi:hypothetical protein